MTKNLNREQIVEQEIVRWTMQRGWACLKMRNESPFEQWPIRGVPDRTILLPGGGAHFVEVKRPGGDPEKKLSVHQILWRQNLMKLGFKVHVVDELDQLVDYFEKEEPEPPPKRIVRRSRRVYVDFDEDDRTIAENLWMED